MSRHCNECSRDGRCIRQKDGTISCGDGLPKSRSHRLKDLNSEMSNIYERLTEIEFQYALLGAQNKAAELRLLNDTFIKLL